MEPKRWQSLRQFGELVALVGVIGSLVFVGLELRQNTVATRAATNAAYADGVREFNLALATSPELARALATWPDDPADASLADQHMVAAMWRALFHMWASTHRQYVDGTLDPALFRALQQEISTYAVGATDNPDILRRAQQMRWAWSIDRFMFDVQFQEFVDGALSNDR